VPWEFWKSFPGAIVEWNVGRWQVIRALISTQLE